MRLIVLAVILVSLEALHSHSKIHHQTNKKNQHFSSDLITLYFQDQFLNMQNRADFISRALTKQDSSKFSFLIGKMSQILKAITQLQESLQKQNLLVTRQSKLCPGLTTFNRTLIKKEIIALQKPQKIAINALTTCKQCQFISNDLRQLHNITSSYIKNLNNTMDGLYCQAPALKKQQPQGLVDLKKSFFKPNLQAKNWFYGSATISDYKIYIFKRSATYNLTSCPLEKPFVTDNEQKCFNCPQGSLFNLGKQRCDTCKPNQILNIESGECDPCLGEKIFKQNKLACKPCMLENGQLFNESNGKCFKCGAESYLDEKKLACIKIQCQPNNPKFNPQTNKCESCGLSQIIDPNDLTKCIKTNFVGLCPPEKPLYSDKIKTCIACQSNKIYSKENNQCIDANSLKNL